MLSLFLGPWSWWRCPPEQREPLGSETLSSPDIFQEMGKRKIRKVRKGSTPPPASQLASTVHRTTKHCAGRAAFVPALLCAGPPASIVEDAQGLPAALGIVLLIEYNLQDTLNASRLAESAPTLPGRDLAWPKSQH